MNLNDFQLDKSINIEGIIAAIAILGAAIGFTINLFRKWKLDYKEKRYRGTNFIILELLELNFQEGLSDDKLWELYSSVDMLEKRKSFSAYKPKKLKHIGFEGQLKYLQSQFLIRLTGPAHYHIDFREPSDWKHFYRKNQYRKILNVIKTQIGDEKLSEILNKTIQDNNSSFYRIKDTYRYLMDSGNNEVIAKIISDLKNDDLNIRQNAVELFIEMNNEIA